MLPQNKNIISYIFQVQKHNILQKKLLLDKAIILQHCQKQPKQCIDRDTLRQKNWQQPDDVNQGDFVCEVI